MDIPDIAEELGVAHVLEGSVRSSGDRIRVTAQLIRANDGFHVWSENYDRDVADMIEVQEDLALNIAKALKTTMDPVALAEMINTGTRSVEAYEAYLRGLALRQEGRTSTASRELFVESYQYFELARSIDPNFAAAHDQAISTAPTATDKKGYMATKALVELRLNEAVRLYSEYLEDRPNNRSARYGLYEAASYMSDANLAKEQLAWRR